jgi:hypothetical protein
MLILHDVGAAGHQLLGHALDTSTLVPAKSRESSGFIAEAITSKSPPQGAIARPIQQRATATALWQLLDQFGPCGRAQP